MESRKPRNVLQEADYRTKIISWIVIGLILFTCWYMLNLALLTFVFVFVFYNLLLVINKRLSQLGVRRTPDKLIVALMYLIFLGALVLVSVKGVPVLAKQVVELGWIISSFNFAEMQNVLDPRIYAVLAMVDFNSYINAFGSGMLTVGTKVGGFGLNIFLAYILSLIMLLERKSLSSFGKRFENSKVSYIYCYCLYFVSSFAKTFGKVMKVQVTISFINTIISMIALALLGFPQVPTLGLMIFILGLIPVLGAFVSLFPLCIIAFNIGGLVKVVAVVIMIAVIHTLEAYVLNPNLMANTTKLPVCLVFIVLLVGEHYLGPWGLLIGVPIFMFLMDIMHVNFQSE